MANVQLAVAGDDTTQVILSVPGVQGPAGSNLPPSGTTNQVLYKQSSTDYDTGWSLVTSAMITDGTIVNGDINTSAAIAGTKISPNFGSQNVLTTGTSTAASFIPTSSGVPANGLYLPSANNVALSTSSTQRVQFGTGEVVFNDGGNNYDFRIEGDTVSNLFFVDASADAVGIGTTSPQELLHLSGSGTQRLRITETGSTLYTQIVQTSSNTGIVAAAPAGLSNGLTFSTTLTGTTFERARIDSSGRLLVGTSSSSVNTRLVVAGNSGSSTGAGNFGLQRGSANPSSGFGLGSIYFADSNEGVGADVSAISEGTWTTGTSYPTRLVFSTTASGASSPTERLRITSAGVLQVADAGNITVGTTTGTKIGTATTQKLGFFNATPVVQPAAVADATDAATVITQLNDLLAKLRTLGIIAT